MNTIPIQLQNTLNCKRDTHFRQSMIATCKQCHHLQTLNDIGYKTREVGLTIAHSMPKKKEKKIQNVMTRQGFVT